MNAGGVSTSMISHSTNDPNLRPGDHVLWKADGKNRTAVVQVVHPSQRVAILKLTDVPESVPESEMVSLLELDPHGTHDITANNSSPSPDELGVHRGEFVFVHKEGTTNGSVMPMVPKIGELEAWVQDVPSLHTMQPGGFTDVIYAEGLKIIMTEENWRDGRHTIIPTGVPVKPVYWFGHVSDVGPLWFRITVFGEPRLGLITSTPQLSTDGQIEVTLPHGEKILVPLQRLTRLYDGLEQLEDMFDEGFSEEGSSMEDALIEGEEWPDGAPLLRLPPHLMPLDFERGAETGDGDEDGDEGKEILDAMILDTMESYMDPPQIRGGLPMDDTSMTPQVSTTPVPQGSSTPQATSQLPEPPRDSENDDLYWKRFDILASAPTDHAFYDRPVAQPSRMFMARLHKEHRALSTGLPGTLILIRVVG